MERLQSPASGAQSIKVWQTAYKCEESLF